MKFRYSMMIWFYVYNVTYILVNFFLFFILDEFIFLYKIKVIYKVN